jgi:hypothetical protein
MASVAGPGRRSPVLLAASAMVFFREWRLARPELEESDRIDE